MSNIMYINQQDAQNSCDYSHTTAGPMLSAYTKHDVQLINVVPEDGLIQSETCRAFNGKMKFNHKILCVLVGLYTYCKMMHGAYNIKSFQHLSVCNLLNSKFLLECLFVLWMLHTF